MAISNESEITLFNACLPLTITYPIYDENRLINVCAITAFLQKTLLYPVNSFIGFLAGARNRLVTETQKKIAVLNNETV